MYSGDFNVMRFIKSVNVRIGSVIYNSELEKDINKVFSYEIRTSIEKESKDLLVLQKKFKESDFDFFNYIFIRSILRSSKLQQSTKNHFSLKLRYLMGFIILDNKFENLLRDLDSIRLLRNRSKIIGKFKASDAKAGYEALMRMVSKRELNELKFELLENHAELFSWSTVSKEKEQAVLEIVEKIRSQKDIQYKRFLSPSNYFEDKSYEYVKVEHERALKAFKTFKSVRYKFANFLNLFNSIGNNNIKKMVPKYNWGLVNFIEVEYLHNFNVRLITYIWREYESLRYRIDEDWKEESEKNMNFKDNYFLVRNSLAHSTTLYEMKRELKVQSVDEVLRYIIKVYCSSVHNLSETNMRSRRTELNNFFQGIESLFIEFKVSLVQTGKDKKIRRGYYKQDIQRFNSGLQKVVRMNFYKTEMSKLYKSFKNLNQRYIS